MPAVLHTLTEGWSTILPPFTLLLDDAPFNLTGFDVDLVLKAKDGTVVSTSGNVTVDADQTINRGKVYYEPDDSDFVAALSPYTLHWKVTDGLGNVVFFPSGQADTLIVTKQ